MDFVLKVFFFCADILSFVFVLTQVQHFLCIWQVFVALDTLKSTKSKDADGALNMYFKQIR